MESSKHQLVAEHLADTVMSAWASEADMTAVFDRCHRGPKFDRTAHGRAIVEKLFIEAWEEEFLTLVPNVWDRRTVVCHLVRALGGDYNLISQVAPNLLPVPLRVRHQELAAIASKTEASFEGRTDVPNPFKVARPKLKVTAATHSPEVVAEYAHATGIAKAASILANNDFSNLSFRVSPLGKTPAFSDSMAYGQLPVAGDPFVEILPAYQQEGYASLFSSWGPEDITLDLASQEDGSIIVPSLPDGHNRFVSESGGAMLGQALVSRSIAGAVLRYWAIQDSDKAPFITVISRLNSMQVIGPREFLTEIQGRVLKGSSSSWDARAPLPVA